LRKGTFISIKLPVLGLILPHGGQSKRDLPNGLGINIGNLHAIGWYGIPTTTYVYIAIDKHCVVCVVLYKMQGT